MKKILLSIKPEYANAIFNGEKTVEYRTKVPASMKEGYVVVYSSAPEKMIIGEFHFSQILSVNPEQLWDMTKTRGYIDKIFFDDYFNGHDIAYAYDIDSVVRYDTPMKLEDLGINRAPQNYQYIDI